MIDETCPKCHKGKMKFYDGCLGYESIQCNSCHYDVNDEVEANGKVSEEL
jgi:uncharacterized protein (DUF983 family)